MEVSYAYSQAEEEERRGVRHPRSWHVKDPTSAACVRRPGPWAAPDPYERLKHGTSERTANLLDRISVCRTGSVVKRAATDA
jgi:hypothetical protein